MLYKIYKSLQSNRAIIIIAVCILFILFVYLYKPDKDSSVKLLSYIKAYNSIAIAEPVPDSYINYTKYKRNMQNIMLKYPEPIIYDYEDEIVEDETVYDDVDIVYEEKVVKEEPKIEPKIETVLVKETPVIQVEKVNNIGKDEIKKVNKKMTGEERTRVILQRIFGFPFNSIRPNFLKNPLTKRNLECDMFCEELRLCVERNGEQHYRKVSFFQDDKQFESQLYRDDLKRKLLDENDYLLFVVPYNIKVDDLEEFILFNLGKYEIYDKHIKLYRDRSNK